VKQEKKGEKEKTRKRWKKKDTKYCKNSGIGSVVLWNVIKRKKHKHIYEPPHRYLLLLLLLLLCCVCHFEFRSITKSRVQRVSERLFISIINQHFFLLIESRLDSSFISRNYRVFLNELFRDRLRRLVSPSCLTRVTPYLFSAWKVRT